MGLRRVVRIFGVCLFLLGGVIPSHAEDLKILKTHYPVMKYDPKTKLPVATFQKSKPAGWIELFRVPAGTKWAFLISEDAGFYSHNGYDITAIRDAVKEGFKKGTFKRGASTISQQVLKNLFLSHERSWLRKVRELFSVSDFEKMYGKNKILELYLNIAELGDGVFGIGQAAQTYFGKSATELTPKESAFLAMLLPSPKKYAISYRKKQLTPYARSTIRRTLGKLKATNHITEEQYAVALRTPLSFEAHSIEAAPPPGSAAMSQAIEEIEDETESDEELLTVTPTASSSSSSLAPDLKKALEKVTDKPTAETPPSDADLEVE